jgi:hypothetical protein
MCDELWYFIRKRIAFLKHLGKHKNASALAGIDWHSVGVVGHKRLSLRQLPPPI